MTATMTDYATYKHFNVSMPSAHVAHVEINRPAKLNAFHQEMWLEYGQLFRALSVDASVRAIVLSGAGDRAFCSGLDITSAPELTSSTSSSSNSSGGGGGGGGGMDPARRAFALRRHIREFQDCIGAAAACEKPVIAVLHGIAYGLAIDIACCADVRLCAADTRFCVKEVDIGIAADIGTLTRLPKVVGCGSWVREVALTARVWGSEEAVSVGFVSRALPGKEQAVAEALKTARLMAEKSPLGVQGTKALVNYSVDHTTQEGLDYTAVWNAAAIQAPDPAIAIQATMQKKKATFAKL